MKTNRRLLDAEIIEMFDKGELREVKLVGVKNTICEGCEFDFFYAELWDFVNHSVDERIKYCPNCGNHIKR